MISISLGFVYVMVTVCTYCYLIGRSRGNRSIDMKKIIFSITWPIQAFRCYASMLKSWDDGDEHDRKNDK